jgi:hypothetical protein
MNVTGILGSMGAFGMVLLGICDPVQEPDSSNRFEALRAVKADSAAFVGTDLDNVQMRISRLARHGRKTRVLFVTSGHSRHLQRSAA